jgi:hypothetical protein
MTNLRDSFLLYNQPGDEKEHDHEDIITAD